MRVHWRARVAMGMWMATVILLLHWRQMRHRWQMTYRFMPAGRSPWRMDCRDMWLRHASAQRIHRGQRTAVWAWSDSGMGVGADIIPHVVIGWHGRMITNFASMMGRLSWARRALLWSRLDWRKRMAILDLWGGWHD